jgi:hypothetical protein
VRRRLALLRIELVKPRLLAHGNRSENLGKVLEGR